MKDDVIAGLNHQIGALVDEINLSNRRLESLPSAKTYDDLNYSVDRTNKTLERTQFLIFSHSAVCAVCVAFVLFSVWASFQHRSELQTVEAVVYDILQGVRYLNGEIGTSE